MKKYAIFFLMALSSYLFAEEEPNYYVNRTRQIELDRGSDLYLGGEFLYWIAQENGLAYSQGGRSFVPHRSVLGIYDFQGRLNKVHPHMHPGVRLNLGYKLFPHDQWDLTAAWTWYYTNRERYDHEDITILYGHVHVDDPNIIDIGTQSDGSFSGYKWRMKYQVYDFAIGRLFKTGKNFSLRPEIGIRGARIPQYLHMQFVFENRQDSISFPATVKVKSNFSGAGIKAGLDGNFHLPKDFHIIAQTSLALLYGTISSAFYEYSYYYDVPTAHLVGKLYADLKEKNNTNLYNGNLKLGLKWDRLFTNDEGKKLCYLALHVAYEAIYWHSINKIMHFVHGMHEGKFYKENGHLTLQGLTAGMRLDF